MDGFIRDRSMRPPAPAWADAAKGEADHRRNRDSLFLLARVRLSEASGWTDVRVRNLSPGGLMAEIAEPLAIDTAVELELRGVGLVRGRVAWQTEGRTGVAFEVEIDPRKARKPVGAAKGNPPYAKPLYPG